MQLIDFFIEELFEVHFASTAMETPYSYALEKKGLLVHQIKLNDSEFDFWIADLNPTLVVFDRFVTEEQFSWRIKENCVQALRILDSEDLHFLREARRLALNKSQSTDFRDHLNNDIARREISSIYRSDLTLIISEFEYELLTEEFKISENLLHYLPFMMGNSGMASKRVQEVRDFSSRSDYMSIGNWKHGPNKDAFGYLKSHIWPSIRKEQPRAKLHIYGAYGLDADQKMQDLSNGFVVHGWAHDKKDAFQKHRVCLAPLRFGAGLKGKLFDSMSYGTPSVTTSVGAEGINGSFPWPGFIEDDPEKTAAKAIQLYQDEDIWKTSQNNGFQILKKRFEKDALSSSFKTRILSAIENKEALRKLNFIGSILWQNSMLSTKYLSKWIEAKNRSHE